MKIYISLVNRKTFFFYPLRLCLSKYLHLLAEFLGNIWWGQLVLE